MSGGKQRTDGDEEPRGLGMYTRESRSSSLIGGSVVKLNDLPELSGLDEKIAETVAEDEGLAGNEPQDEDSGAFVEFNLGGEIEPGYIDREDSEKTSEQEEEKVGKLSVKNVEDKAVLSADSKMQGSEVGSDTGSVMFEYDEEDDAGEWQEMPTVAASYDVYNDKGELINNATGLVNENGKEMLRKSKEEPRSIPSSQGYTRIAIQQQAITYAETDRKTDFLFKNSTDNLSKSHLGLSDESKEEDEEDEDEYDDYVDDTTRNALDQMQATKEMLKEEEVIAYVGLVKLLMAEMATDLAKLSSHLLKNSKRISSAQASLAVWSQKVMSNLYEHMEFSKEERKMIELLSKHGVEPADLARSLVKVEVVNNPMFQTDEDTKFVQVDCPQRTENGDDVLNDGSLNKTEEVADRNEQTSCDNEGKPHGTIENDEKPLTDGSKDEMVKNNEDECFVEQGNNNNIIAEDTQSVISNNKSTDNNSITNDDKHTNGKNDHHSITDIHHSINIDDNSTTDNNLMTNNNHSDILNNNSHTSNTKEPTNASLIKNQKTIEIDVAWTVICDLFLILIYDSVYDSRSRTLLMKFGETLGLKNFEICQFERRITDALEIDEGSEQTLDEKEIINYRAKKAKRRRMIAIGLAGVGGSLILGISGGLLGPLIGAGIAAGLSTVGIAGTSSFLAGTAGTAIVTTVSTGIGAKVGATGMMRRTGAVKTFEFRPLHNNKRVNLIITISGWMNSVVDDIRLPFSTVDPAMGDLYSLLWEPEMLTTVGQTINILATEILTQSVQQILGATILTALMSAIQVPMALSKLGYLLDNPWNVSLNRAWAAGYILADTLISRNLGVRPVTLVGFSSGSRLIYSCLLELARKGAFDLVENVIIFGSPFVCHTEQLTLCRSVVSGRFINGYSKKDWILGYLFRATSGGIRRVAGLSQIEGIEGIENVDCTPYVTGHMEYRTAMPKLLKLVGWNVLSEEFIEIDEPDPEQSERQRELVLEFDKNAKQILQDKSGKSQNRKSGWKSWFKPKRKEWWEVYAEGQQELKEKNETMESENTPKADPNAEYQLFNVEELKNEINEMKQNGELQKINEELQKKNEELQGQSMGNGPEK